MRITREAFEKLVTEALGELPAEFAAKLENVEVIIEDEPSHDALEGHELAPGHLLLGLYHGVPLTQRSVFAIGLFPERITLFQRPLETISHTPHDIIENVRHTVLHEIAHHFGISDARLRELGY